MKPLLTIPLCLCFSCANVDLNDEVNNNDTSTSLFWCDTTKGWLDTVAFSEESHNAVILTLNLVLKDPSIDDYYKQVYEKEKIIAANDSIMLSITDSLFTNNPNHAMFYFIVFTKSMNGSDGFYSEALGLRALEYISTYPYDLRFVNYFSIPTSKITDADLHNWAQCIWGELVISKEGKVKQALAELRQQLLIDTITNNENYNTIMTKLFNFIELEKEKYFSKVNKQ